MLQADKDSGSKLPHVFQVTVYGSLHPLPLLGKVKAGPDPDGAEYGILGMKLAKNLEIVGSLSAIDGRLGILSLDLVMLTASWCLKIKNM